MIVNIETRVMSSNIYRVKSRIVIALLHRRVQSAQYSSSCVVISVNENKKAVLSQRWPRDARYGHI